MSDPKTIKLKGGGTMTFLEFDNGPFEYVSADMPIEAYTDDELVELLQEVEDEAKKERKIARQNDDALQLQGAEGSG